MGELSDYGMLDRRDIAKQNVKLVLCETPVVIGGQGFTTGKIKRNSIEKVLPNTMVEFKLKIWCRMQCEPLPAGRNGGQDRARRAHP